MQEQHLFEYAVIRIVPQVEREEFLNVGVVLYCAKQKFLQVRYILQKEKITSFSSLVDVDDICCYLLSFEKICAGDKAAGAIAKLTIAERFRWLTAMRSTVVQTSRVHPGLCINAAETLDALFTKLVL
jgi:hypothetical protein